MYFYIHCRAFSHLSVWNSMCNFKKLNNDFTSESLRFVYNYPHLCLFCFCYTLSDSILWVSSVLQRINSSTNHSNKFSLFSSQFIKYAFNLCCFFLLNFSKKIEKKNKKCAMQRIRKFYRRVCILQTITHKFYFFRSITFAIIIIFNFFRLPSIHTLGFAINFFCFYFFFYFLIGTFTTKTFGTIFVWIFNVYIEFIFRLHWAALSLSIVKGENVF